MSAALRIIGSAEAGDSALYYYVLSAARWDSRDIVDKPLAMILNRLLRRAGWSLV